MQKLSQKLHSSIEGMCNWYCQCTALKNSYEEKKH